MTDLLLEALLLSDRHAKCLHLMIKQLPVLLLLLLLLDHPRIALLYEILSRLHLFLCGFGHHYFLVFLVHSK